LKEKSSAVRFSRIRDDGPEKISTGDPSDKSDRDILEAVIDFDDNSKHCRSVCVYRAVPVRCPPKIDAI